MTSSMYSFHCCVWHTVLGTLGDPVPHILVILWRVALDSSSLQPFQMEAFRLLCPVVKAPSFEPYILD